MEWYWKGAIIIIVLMLIIPFFIGMYSRICGRGLWAGIQDAEQAALKLKETKNG